MKVLIIFVCWFAISSCSPSKGEKAYLIELEKLEFNSGFYSKNVQLSEFEEKEYLCFADFETNKKIACHSLDSTDHFDVNLNLISRLGDRIESAIVVNRDTIIILSHRTNHLFIINSNGLIKKFINLNPYLEKFGAYELGRTVTNIYFSNGTLVYALEFLIDNIEESKRNDLTVYYGKKYRSPQLFRIENIFEEKLNVSVGLGDFYNKFADSTQLGLESPNFSFNNNQIVFCSIYSDSVFFINRNTLAIERAEQVKSDFGNIGVKPITLKQSQMDNSLYNENYKTEAVIGNVLYNDTLDQFYVFILHKLENEVQNWSIIVCDKDFKKLHEQFMDSKVYSIFPAIISKKGLLISNTPSVKGDEDHFVKNTMAIFKTQENTVQ